MIHNKNQHEQIKRRIVAQKVIARKRYYYDREKANTWVLLGAIIIAFALAIIFSP